MDTSNIRYRNWQRLVRLGLYDNTYSEFATRYDKSVSALDSRLNLIPLLKEIGKKLNVRQVK